MPFDTAPTQPTTRPASQLRRVDMLAGCTVLGARLADARALLRRDIALHRKAQARYASPYRMSCDCHPSVSRKHVLKAVARIREIEAQVEAKYGKFVPVRGAV